MRRSPTAIGMGSEMLGAAQQVGQEQLSLQTTSDQELRALIMAALGAGMAPGEVDGTAAAGAAVGVGVAVGAGVAWVGAGAAGDSAGGTGAGVAGGRSGLGLHMRTTRGSGTIRRNTFIRIRSGVESLAGDAALASGSFGYRR